MRATSHQDSKPVSGIPRLSRLKESVTHTRKFVPTSCNAFNSTQEGQPKVGIAAPTGSNSTSRGGKTKSKDRVASELGSPKRQEMSSANVPRTSEDASNHSAPLFEIDAKVTAPLSEPTGLQLQTPRTKRKPRPSLSDRTIETLSQIPASPSSHRRRSSFFIADSTGPMQSPLRPASAMTECRSRPTSPIKPLQVPFLPTSFSAKSSVLSLPQETSITQQARPSLRPPVDGAANHSSFSTTVGFERITDRESSKSNIAVCQAKPSREQKFSSDQLPKKPLARRQPPPAKPSKPFTASRKPSSVSTSTTVSFSPCGSPRSSIQLLQSCSTAVEASLDAPSKNIRRPSTALRGAIAKAKEEAASRKASASSVRHNVATFPETGVRSGEPNDPYALEISGALLRNRIEGALVCGHLNVAAMDLKSIPIEIKQMYEVSENTNVEWSECVDLSKFIAADNKLEKLEDDIFPDLTSAELADAEGADHNGLLRGLEGLDLHNNLLRDLPVGFRRLQKLRSLNLSGNKLGEQALDIICQVGNSLTDLRMSKNELSGILPHHFGKLPNLQVLHLHGNDISELPEGLQQLAHLRILNLAQNRLSSISSELLAHSTLVDLNLSGNRLSGVLFPPHIKSASQSLKLLDVSHNTLEAVAAADITLVNVQVLNLHGNRIKSLPDLSSWKELLTFTIAENQICEIPPGLVTLRKLKNADLSNNNITKIDEGIATMENLISLNLAGNPLRERKYPSMSTFDLKADIQKHSLTFDAPLKADAGIPNFNSSNGGVLDWSSRSLSFFELPMADFDGSIFDLRLHHNALNAIPVSLCSHLSISETLKTLDMSHNPLQAPYLSAPISLPQLRELCLASCGLKGLDGLTSNLSATNLTTLDLSTNHLSGTLPRLRTYFPALTTLLVADNHFSGLEVNAVQGLINLDIRNNEVAHLEPRLGLLSGKTGLKCLKVSGNKFRVPRRDILEKGTEAVLRYLRGRVPLEELGDESVGVDVDAEI